LKILIITEKYGDLGNRLYRFSRFYSCRSSDIFIIDISLFQYSFLFCPKNVIYNILFKILSLINTDKYNKICSLIHNNILTKEINIADYFFNNNAKCIDLFNSIKKSKSHVFYIKSNGFFYKNTEYDDKNKTDLREIFRFKKTYIEKSQSLLRSKKKGSVLIGVHIRRGDYKNFDGGKYYFDDHVYARLIRNLVRSSDSNYVYEALLISNETITTENYKGIEILYFGPQEAAVDQLLLQQCSYIIAPDSTFSGWASFIQDIPIAIVKSPSSCIKWSDFTIKNTI
jgi:hypothetical protein